MVTRLRFERLRQEISLERLYQRSGVRPTDISLAERGRLKLTSVQLTRLAAVFGVEPSEALLREVGCVEVEGGSLQTEASGL